MRLAIRFFGCPKDFANRNLQPNKRRSTIVTEFTAISGTVEKTRGSLNLFPSVHHKLMQFHSVTLQGAKSMSVEDISLRRVGISGRSQDRGLVFLHFLSACL